MKTNKKIPLFIVTIILLISLPSQVFALTYLNSPQIADDVGLVGLHSSMISINGYPAITYYNETRYRLQYIRAKNTDGSIWENPVAVDDGGVGIYSSLERVSGNPAVSYYDSSNSRLKYARATSSSGLTWNTPVVVDETDDVGMYTSLTVVNGNPAISYFDYTNGALKYVRATDAHGTGWGTPITLDNSSDTVGWYTTLIVLDGRPAVSYYDQSNECLKFIRANDVNGGSWPTTADILDNSGDVGEYASMAIINGNPAIAYYDYSNWYLKYIRATNATGSNWGLPEFVVSSGRYDRFSSLAEINGRPAISFKNGSNRSLDFIQANDANGADWPASATTVDDTQDMGEFNSMIDLNGSPAISYSGYTTQSLSFIYLSNTVNISVSDGGMPINSGDTLDFGTTTLQNPVTYTLTINNSGSAPLNLTNFALPTGFSIIGNHSNVINGGSSANIVFRLDALQTGTFSGNLRINSTDSNQSPFTLALTGEVTPAIGEIAVLDGSTELTDGVSTVNIGTTTLGTPLTRTFTIENSNSEDLNLYSLSLPSGFSLLGTYDLVVGSGATTNITVRLDAFSVGSYSGDFSLSNDDADENPFNFRIEGVVEDTSGEIAVLDGLTGIADGETIPIDFGDTTIGNPISRTFTIQNLGVNDLDLYSLTLPHGFSLQGSYNHVVAPSGSTSITVQLDSQFVGTYSGEFSLSSDDTDEDPFNFAIEGNVLSADGEISVFDGATEITDGSSSVDFGDTPQGTPLSRTFTIHNTSTEVLDLFALTLPSGFSLQNSYDHTVDPNHSTTTVVQLDAQIVGSYSGQFSLSNDDADEDPFNFTISGEVINTALETDIIVPLNGSTVLDSQLQVAFNHDVLHDGSDEAADNPINYLLVEDGRNGLFDTTTCLLGVAGDDVQQTINSVTYDDSNYIATINTDPLPASRYQLLVCGTASIEDATGNVLNGGAFDSATTFTVVAAETGDGDALDTLLPATGFTPGEQNHLPIQPANLAYNEMDSLTLQIPSLKVHVPIVGVPQTANGWDVTWLTNAQAGWLNGTAYPTWEGNTVLTGHVSNASGNPGPFADIKTLKFGDRITIQAYSEEYTYEVRENKLVTRDNLSVVEEHKSRDWVTLITCEYFNENTGQYLYRRVVRAVLVEVE